MNVNKVFFFEGAEKVVNKVVFQIKVILLLMKKKYWVHFFLIKILGTFITL